MMMADDEDRLARAAGKNGGDNSRGGSESVGYFCVADR